MAKQRIHIENLRIKLPSQAAGNAQRIAQEVGREIIKSISDVSLGRTGAVRVDEISAPKVKASNGVADTRKRVAVAVSTELKKRLG